MYELHIETDEGTTIDGPYQSWTAATAMADLAFSKHNMWDVTIHDGEGNVWGCSWTLVKKEGAEQDTEREAYQEKLNRQMAGDEEW